MSCENLFQRPLTGKQSRPSSTCNLKKKKLVGRNKLITKHSTLYIYRSEDETKIAPSNFLVGEGRGWQGWYLPL